MAVTPSRPPSGLSLLRLLLVILACQAPALYLIWAQGRDVHNLVEDVQIVTEDTNRVVRFIDDQTSPETQARQEEVLDEILVRIACDDALRLQRVVDGLVEQGLVEPIDVRANCGG